MLYSLGCLDIPTTLISSYVSGSFFPAAFGWFMLTSSISKCWNIPGISFWNSFIFYLYSLPWCSSCSEIYTMKIPKFISHSPNLIPEPWTVYLTVSLACLFWHVVGILNLTWDQKFLRFSCKLAPSTTSLSQDYSNSFLTDLPNFVLASYFKLLSR